MFRRRLLLLLPLIAATVLRAQSTVPAVSTPIPPQSLRPGDAAVTIDLRNHFSLPGVSGPLVQFDTVMGLFNVELHVATAPRHVANFLAYVRADSYVTSFIHRSASFNFVGGEISIVQGGGYRLPLVTTIPKLPPVALEYQLPNVRGALAAARGSDINSATSEWFFNVRDNAITLDPANGGGYTVFGRVLGTGMTVVDAIAALPVSNQSGTTDPNQLFGTLPVRNYSGGNASTENLVMVNSVREVATYPGSDAVPILSFTLQNSAPGIVTEGLSGSVLSLTPRNVGTASVTVRATDTYGNVVEATFAVIVTTTPPAITVQPVPQSFAAGATVALNVLATGATSYQWRRNGVMIPGATSATLTLNNAQPTNAGIYTVAATNGSGTSVSRPAVLGVSSTVKLLGGGTEFPNIFHPGTGFTYDQILLGGAAASVTADPGQILRISYLDLNDDIVQVEFSGAGTLTLLLDAATGPAPPVKYNQPSVSYMRGHASVILTGANASTNLTVFSVGRAIPGSNPALYSDSITYDGFADLAYIAIVSTDGKFAGLRAANVSLFATGGMTGVHAPGIQFSGPVFIHDINASADASPVFEIGAGGDVRVTGGNLLQANGRAVTVSGITQLRFTAGSTSHGTLLAAQANQGKLEQNGVNVTTQIVVNP